MNFMLILFVLTVVSGGLYVTNTLYFTPHEHLLGQKLGEYARTFFPIFLTVFLVRSFLVEPYRIPSGSLEPTLLTGDYIIVNKFEFGLRFPLFNTLIAPLHQPQVGDIVVFHWPPNPRIAYIKRFIAKAGDKVDYIHKVLYINGKRQTQEFITHDRDSEHHYPQDALEKRTEILHGHAHYIYINPSLPAHDFSITVPKGHYLAMGDNRDDSSDSRFWGFVPERNIIGKATFIWLSWDKLARAIRWQRFGQPIT